VRSLRQLGDERGLGQVVPVARGHFLFHHAELEPRGVEDVAVVGEPQRLARIGRRRVAALRAGAGVQLLPVPAHAGVGREDGPAHLREAADEKARVGHGDVVVGLEPGHVQGVAIGLHHGPKAHKGVHLVHVAPHGAGHVVGLHAVGVQRVVPRGVGLCTALGHAPQQAVHQCKAGGVAVQDQLLAQVHKVGRYAQRRHIGGWRWQGVVAGGLGGKQVFSGVGLAAPVHGLWGHVGLHQSACGRAKALPVGGVVEGNGVALRVAGFQRACTFPTRSG